MKVAASAHSTNDSNRRRVAAMPTSAVGDSRAGHVTPSS
jgi:hypothetical protein